VNATVIPQQGSASPITNPYARVRAVAGIQPGHKLSASLGGTTLLFAAAANTVSQYAQVQAGTQILNLTLDVTGLIPSNQALTAGADYTILVLNGPALELANTTTTTLIPDDNRLPTSSTYAKISLVNAMSALGDPITLNVNFTPEVTTPVLLGSSSGMTQVTAGTDIEFDTFDANTSLLLLSNANTSTLGTLTGSGVYDLFLFGGAPASAVLPVEALHTNRP
jgi:hypothetical protein